VKADTPTRKIGILGVGSIGQSLARAVEQKDIDAELVALSDQDREKAEAFAASLSSHPPVVPTGELIEHAELIVEAASQAVLPEFVPMALARVRDMLIMSVGGLLGHEEWFREAGEKGCRIYIPSGAIAGLDGIQIGFDGPSRVGCPHEPQAHCSACGHPIRSRSRRATAQFQARDCHLRRIRRRSCSRISHHLQCRSHSAFGDRSSTSGACPRRGRAWRKQECARDRSSGRIWPTLGERRERSFDGQSPHFATGCIFGHRNSP
jgi:hypothetical protein